MKNFLRREFFWAVKPIGKWRRKSRNWRVLKLINLAGKTTLQEAIYLISQCRLFISNDSGLMHIAGALNIPTIATFWLNQSRYHRTCGKQIHHRSPGSILQSLLERKHARRIFVA